MRMSEREAERQRSGTVSLRRPNTPSPKDLAELQRIFIESRRRCTIPSLNVAHWLKHCRGRKRNCNYNKLGMLTLLNIDNPSLQVYKIHFPTSVSGISLPLWFFCQLCAKANLKVCKNHLHRLSNSNESFPALFEINISNLCIKVHPTRILMIMHLLVRYSNVLMGFYFNIMCLTREINVARRGISPYVIMPFTINVFSFNSLD